MSRAKNAEMFRCTCGRVEVAIPGGNVGEIPTKHRQFLASEKPCEAGFVYLSTDCEAETWGMFAPGHDARVAGLLQTADRAGGSAMVDGDGHSMSGEKLAGLLSDALAAKVAAQPKVRAARKPKTAKAPIRAKVGRWVFEGTVQGDGSFEYVAKKTGLVQRVAGGKWSIVHEVEELAA